MNREPARTALSEFKFVNHIEQLEQLASGTPLADLPPISVEIDPTNLCNSGCTWCSSANFRREVRASLDLETTSTLLDELSDYGVKSVVFKGGGDPSMVTWIADAVRRAASRGLAIGMNTNGARLSQDLADALVECASWVRFSVDAASAELYRAVHRTREWPQVDRNIRSLVAQRDASITRLIIGVNHNLDEHNIAEVERMVELAAEWGVDYVAIRPVYWNLTRRDPARADVHADVRDAMRRAEQAAEAYPRLTLKSGNVRNTVGPFVEDPGPCFAPALLGIVCADGSVAACCDLRGHAKYSFGNINDNSFREIWEGNVRRRIVIDHTSKRECDPFCSHAYAYHNKVLEYLRTDRPQAEFL